MARTLVQTELIADNSVTSAKIAQNSILTKHIDDNQITTDQIAANTIATANVADNAIDATKIASNSILTRHIDDNQIGIDQLNVSDGSSGQALTTNGSGTLSFSTISSGLATSGGTLTGNLTMGGMILKPSADGGSIGLNRNPDNGNHVGDSSLRRFQINGPDSTGGDFIQIQSYNSSGTHQGNINIQDGHFGVGMTPAPVGSDTVLAVYDSATPRIKLHNSTTGTASSDGGEINMSSSDLIIENREAGNQRFFTNGSERLRINSSGNIGFNTTDVTVGSSVSGNSTATPSFITFNNNYSNGYTDASLKLYLFNSGTTRQGFTSGPAYDLQYHSSGSDAGRHAFHVANTEIMRINKTQVGIGDSGVIASNTASTLAVRKDNSAGRGGEISIVNYAANATGNEAALNFGLENSTYDSDNGNAQIKARVMGSSAQTAMIFSNWRGSSFNEAMRINENGTLMVGTSTNATYTHKAHFSGNANIDGIVRIEDVDGTVALSNAVLGLAFSGDNDASNGYFIYMTDGNGAIGSISVASGTSVAFNTTSDERLKKNIVDASSQLDTIKNIKVREFDWKKNDFHEVGVIAQEIKSIVPNAVTEGGDDETERPFGVDYGKIVPYLIKAVQEQQTIIDDLKSRIETLEG